MKVVINKCFGGFGLSEDAYEYLGLKWDGYGWAYNDYDKRTAPELVECVETLGSKVASGYWARLEVVEVPDGEAWEIDYYDGFETVIKPKQVWG